VLVINDPTHISVIMDDIMNTSFLMLESTSEMSDYLSDPLTPLRIQFLDDFIYDILMASSDVDQKFLGKFAKETARDDPLLSQMLFKILGLSVLLTKKLFRARRLRRLDVTRDTKSLQLYYHIIWLSREGLVILEEYVLPLVQDRAELKVLAYKLRGSFYHIFVLFHNQPSINQTAIPSASPAATEREKRRRSSGSSRSSPGRADPMDGGPVTSAQLPPGLLPIAIPKPAASFLLPATDYIPRASSCFATAAALATALLSGSHPLRLSVAVEYAAYLHDCLHDAEGARKLAQHSIRAVYTARDGMDDDAFADSAALVAVLGRMMRRGLAPSSGSSTAAARTPATGPLRADSERYSQLPVLSPQLPKSPRRRSPRQ